MQILEQLGSGAGLPTEAIRAATADRTIVTPQLLEAIDGCESPSDVEENGLFIAFHLLGQWREQSAYRPLARFLRRPNAGLILGDGTTETCHRVMASVFDGDPRPIYDIIRDSEADEFVRMRIFDSLVILVFRGELDRTAVADFLRSVFDDLQPPERSAVWDGWQGAIALLALNELAPLVREAFRRGLIDETATSLKNFEDGLQRACAGHPLRSWEHEEFEPFGDVIDELSSWAGFKPKQPREQSASSWRPNPWPAMRRTIRSAMSAATTPAPAAAARNSRNAVSARAEQLEFATPDDSFAVDEMDEFGDVDGPIWDYDALVEPDPDEWLAADEQWRLDVIEATTGREGIAVERATLHATMHAVVENQIAEGDRLPVRRILLRLVAEGLDRHDAIHAIAAVLAGHINELMRKPARRRGRPSGSPTTNSTPPIFPSSKS